MDLTIDWLPPLRLRDGRADNLIYTTDEMDRIPDAPGVYVFARRFGARVTPIYIGRAGSLSRRIPQQLNNASLMTALQNAPAGHRILLVGQWLARPGQQPHRWLPVIESALIKYALAEGCELFNTQETRQRTHSILSKGSTGARSWLERCINVEAT